MEPLSMAQVKERLRTAHTRKAQALTILLSNPSSVAVCQQAEIDRTEATQELERLFDLQDSLYALEEDEV